jgi:hypothetical protein
MTENYGKYFGGIFANLIEELVAEDQGNSQYQKFKAALEAEYANADKNIKSGAWKRGGPEMKAHVQRANALMKQKHLAWDKEKGSK